MNAFLPRRTRRQALATIGSALAAALPGCGGSSDGDASGSARMRALNLASDLASIDLLLDDTLRYPALASAALSEYQTLDAATVALKVRRAGDATPLLNASHVLGKVCKTPGRSA